MVRGREVKPDQGAMWTYSFVNRHAIGLLNGMAFTNTVDDARYRLTLAEGQLADAERDYEDQRWHLCVASAQSAAENAGKAIIACFLPIEKTQEPVKQIEAMLEEGIIPDEVREAVVDVLPGVNA